MNVYDNIFKFKGSWRSYQERVLKHADTYLQDGKNTYCGGSGVREDNPWY